MMDYLDAHNLVKNAGWFKKFWYGDSDYKNYGDAKGTVVSPERVADTIKRMDVRKPGFGAYHEDRLRADKLRLDEDRKPQFDLANKPVDIGQTMPVWSTAPGPRQVKNMIPGFMANQQTVLPGGSTTAAQAAAQANKGFNDWYEAVYKMPRTSKYNSVIPPYKARQWAYQPTAIHTMFDYNGNMRLTQQNGAEALTALSKSMPAGNYAVNPRLWQAHLIQNPALARMSLVQDATGDWTNIRQKISLKPGSMFEAPPASKVPLIKSDTNGRAHAYQGTRLGGMTIISPYPTYMYKDTSASAMHEEVLHNIANLRGFYDPDMTDKASQDYSAYAERMQRWRETQEAYKAGTGRDPGKSPVGEWPEILSDKVRTGPVELWIDHRQGHYPYAISNSNELGVRRMMLANAFRNAMGRNAYYPEELHNWYYGNGKFSKLPEARRATKYIKPFDYGTLAAGIEGYDPRVKQDLPLSNRLFPRYPNKKEVAESVTPRINYLPWW